MQAFPLIPPAQADPKVSVTRYNRPFTSHFLNHVNDRIHPLLVTILITWTLSACSTAPVEVPEPEPDPPPEVPVIAENPDIVKARSALAEVKAAKNEWLIVEPELSEYPVSLSEILQFAETLHQDGHGHKASELARKVTRLSQLGIAQTNAQAEATPYYPR